jgi:hypothetical protein
MGRAFDPELTARRRQHAPHQHATTHHFAPTQLPIGARRWTRSLKNLWPVPPGGAPTGAAAPLSVDAGRAPCYMGGMRDSTLLVLIVLVGCGGGNSASDAPTSASTQAATAAACTGETPLVPGIPGSPGHLLASDVNPNGASELADRMRQMQGHLQTVRAAHVAGQPMTRLPFEEFERIRCSWPTTPGDRPPEFDAMAQAYLGLVRAYNEAPSPASYSGVLQGCVTCHQQTCTGAIAAIEPLFLPSHPMR